MALWARQPSGQGGALPTASSGRSGLGSLHPRTSHPARAGLPRNSAGSLTHSAPLLWPVKPLVEVDTPP